LPGRKNLNLLVLIKMVGFLSCGNKIVFFLYHRKVSKKEAAVNIFFHPHKSGSTDAAGGMRPARGGSTRCRGPLIYLVLSVLDGNPSPL
jgi:hypothetical protein